MQAERIQRTPLEADNNIQRAPAAPARADANDPSDGASGQDDGTPGEEDANIDEIAQQVYAQLKRRLTIEYERQYRR